MIFTRHIESALRRWKASEAPKPLLLRGARQVGKTFSVNRFAAAEFDDFITLNLERPAERALFLYEF